jgi:hypothetical protein
MDVLDHFRIFIYVFFCVYELMCSMYIIIVIWKFKNIWPKCYFLGDCNWPNHSKSLLKNYNPVQSYLLIKVFLIKCVSIYCYILALLTVVILAEISNYRFVAMYIPIARYYLKNIMWTCYLIYHTNLYHKFILKPKL